MGIQAYVKEIYGIIIGIQVGINRICRGKTGEYMWEYMWRYRGNKGVCRGNTCGNSCGYTERIHVGCTEGMQRYVGGIQGNTCGNSCGYTEGIHVQRK